MASWKTRLAPPKAFGTALSFELMPKPALSHRSRSEGGSDVVLGTGNCAGKATSPLRSAIAVQDADVFCLVDAPYEVKSVRDPTASRHLDFSRRLHRA